MQKQAGAYCFQAYDILAEGTAGPEETSAEKKEWTDTISQA